MTRDPWDPTSIEDRFDLLLYRAKEQPSFQTDARWYAEQEAWLRELPVADTPRLIAAVAVLSPQVSWASQVKYTPRLADRWEDIESVHEIEYPGLLANRKKAYRLIQGEHPTDVLSGPKVCAFYQNLTGNEEPVTVDTHMVDAALDLRCPAEREGIHLTAHRYRTIEAALQKVAPIHSLSPAMAQAAIWSYVRRDRSISE